MFHNGILSDSMAISFQCLISEEVAFLKLAANCPADFIPHWHGWILSRTGEKTKKNYLSPNFFPIWKKNGNFMTELQVILHICLNDIGYTFHKIFLFLKYKCET